MTSHAQRAIEPRECTHHNAHEATRANRRTVILGCRWRMQTLIELGSLFDRQAVQ
jgi:hypothetical protein